MFTACSCKKYQALPPANITGPEDISIASSIKDFNILLMVIKPGDTLVIKDGVYENFIVSINATGNEDKPITIKAQTPGGVQFKKDSQITFSGASYIVFRDFFFNNNIRLNKAGDYVKNSNVLLTNKSNNISITNNKFYKSGNNNHSFGPVVYITEGSTYNKIENNTFDDSHGVAVYITTKGPSQYNLVAWNHFLNLSTPKIVFNREDGNGMESILIGTDKSVDMHTVVEYNLFENIVGDKSEIISNKSSSNIYRYNTFRDNESMLTLRNGNNCLVEGNFFFNNKGGIRTFGAGHVVINNYIEGSKSGWWYASISVGYGSDNYDTADDAKVINNTIVNPKGNGLIIGATSQPLQPRNVLIKNNLIISKQNIAVDEIDGSEVTYLNNILSLQESANPGKTGSGIIEVFVEVVEDGILLRPTYNSAVIGAGVSSEFVIVDMDGQARKAVPDVGADEVSSTPIILRPLTAVDVGCDF